ncbi:unnamed protein product [Orchesella dallaii]|uniref:Peptidase S1 domain-containing protein n=1 Tax=Orchesella dallaii TaxID=48710 RepID=A0ABP1RVD0_9HEXA
MRATKLFLFLILGTLNKVEGNIAILPLPKHSAINSRIVGGKPADEGEFPYQIRLMWRNKFICGGSFVIVNDQHLVLTAAHCLSHDDNPQNYKIIAGDIKICDKTGREQDRQVTGIMIHPDFGLKYKLVNDIAVLFINEPLTINNFVFPIHLPRQDQRISGNLMVSGWGKLGTYSGVPDTLQKVEIDIVPDSLCKMAVPGVRPFPANSTVCTGWNGKSACYGDSGGPLRAIEGGYLAGIVSFSSSKICGDRFQPNVNTRVSHYIKWIEELALKPYESLAFYAILLSESESKISKSTTEISQNQPKIENGNPAKQEEIPYQIALYYNHGFWCGGSFVVVNCKHFIITAAHCVEDDLNPGNYNVVAGEVNKYRFDLPAQVRNITEIIVHEDYVHTFYFIGNDIALLGIDCPFEINDIAFHRFDYREGERVLVDLEW